MDHHDPDLGEELGQRLFEHNIGVTGIDDGRQFSEAIRDEDGLAAGVHGWTWGSTAWIERLWVRADRRGQRLGSLLVMQVEQHARRMSCVQIALTTHSFQAPDFYASHGFEITGRLPDYPLGHELYFMVKRL